MNVFLFLEKQCLEIYKNGWRALLAKSIKMFVLCESFVVGLLFYFFLFLLARTIIFLVVKKDLKIVRLHCGKIGHLVANTEIFFRKQRKYEAAQVINIGFCENRCVCNQYVLTCIQKGFPFFLTTYLGQRLWLIGNLLDPSRFVDVRNSSDRDVDGLFTDKSLDINLYDDVVMSCAKNLQLFSEESGFDVNQPFVCLMCRDDQYHSCLKGVGADRSNDYRNTRIEDFAAVVDLLRGHGYQVVRMGRYMEDLPPSLSRKIFNYAQWKGPDAVKDKIDVLLAIKCEFVISTLCGWDSLPTVLRKPILFVNVAPVGYAPTYISNSMWFPKLIRDKKTGRILELKEVFDKHLAFVLDGEELSSLGYEYVGLSMKGLEEAVKQFLFLAKRRFAFSEEDLTRNRDVMLLVENSDGAHLHNRFNSVIGNYDNVE